MRNIATLLVMGVLVAPALAQEAEPANSLEVPSILRHLSSDQMALMSLNERQETQGQGLEGIESLIKSRQLRYQLLRNSLLPDGR